MDLLKVFGARIREIRHNRGISQEELAYRSGLHRTYVGAVERGERNISLKNVLRIAEALNISIEDLFSDLSRSK